MTQHQYSLLLDLANSLPAALSSGESVPQEALAESVPSSPATDLVPEISVSAHDEKGTTETIQKKLAFHFTVPSVNLEIYDSEAVSAQSLKNHSIAAFRLGQADIDYKSVSDGSSQAEVAVKSFTMTNTRPGKAVYRELVPEAKHDGNQL